MFMRRLPVSSTLGLLLLAAACGSAQQSKSATIAQPASPTPVATALIEPVHTSTPQPTPVPSPTPASGTPFVPITITSTPPSAVTQAVPTLQAGQTYVLLRQSDFPPGWQDLTDSVQTKPVVPEAIKSFSEQWGGDMPDGESYLYDLSWGVAPTDQIASSAAQRFAGTITALYGKGQDIREGSFGHGNSDNVFLYRDSYGNEVAEEVFARYSVVYDAHIVMSKTGSAGVTLQLLKTIGGGLAEN